MARPKSNPQVMLRPQDLMVLLRLALERGPAPTYAVLAAELGMTASEVHGAVERAVMARLAHKDTGGKATVSFAALRLFIQHGALLLPGNAWQPDARHADQLCGTAAQGADPTWNRPLACMAAQRRHGAWHCALPALPERGGSARERALAVDLLEKRLQPRTQTIPTSPCWRWLPND